MAKLTQGTFKVGVVDTKAIGNDLVVVHARHRMTLQGAPIVVDAVVVWRIVGGKITEVWDIPAVFDE